MTVTTVTVANDGSSRRARCGWSRWRAVLDLSLSMWSRAARFQACSWQGPSGPAGVEGSERDRAVGVQPPEQQRTDDEPGDDEKNVDTDEAARKSQTAVASDDQKDRHRPQPLDIGAVPDGCPRCALHDWERLSVGVHGYPGSAPGTTSLEPLLDCRTWTLRPSSATARTG